MKPYTYYGEKRMNSPITWEQDNFPNHDSKFRCNKEKTNELDYLTDKTEQHHEQNKREIRKEINFKLKKKKFAMYSQIK